MVVSAFIEVSTWNGGPRLFMRMAHEVGTWAAPSASPPFRLKPGSLCVMGLIMVCAIVVEATFGVSHPSYGRVLLCGVHVQSASAARQDTIVRVHRFLLALPLRPDSCRHPPRSLLVARCSRPFRHHPHHRDDMATPSVTLVDAPLLLSHSPTSRWGDESLELHDWHQLWNLSSFTRFFIALYNLLFAGVLMLYEGQVSGRWMHRFDARNEMRVCWPSAAIPGQRFGGQAVMLAKPAGDYVIGETKTQLPAWLVFFFFV